MAAGPSPRRTNHRIHRLLEALTIDTLTTRRVGANEASAYIGVPADVPIDCVEDGASVSFMVPLSQDKVRAFWRDVAEGAARGERAPLIAGDEADAIYGTVQLVFA